MGRDPPKPGRVEQIAHHRHIACGSFYFIDTGFTAIAIADRMGHEAAGITYRYAHLFSSVQANMARALDGARREN